VIFVENKELEEKVNLFIKLAEELLSRESLCKMIPILLKDCKVMLDVGLYGPEGIEGKV